MWVAANAFARKGFSSSETGKNYEQPKVEKGAEDKSCLLVSGQVSNHTKVVLLVKYKFRLRKTSEHNEMMQVEISGVSEKSRNVQQKGQICMPTAPVVHHHPGDVRSRNNSRLAELLFKQSMLRQH